MAVIIVIVALVLLVILTILLTSPAHTLNIHLTTRMSQNTPSPSNKIVTE